MYNFQGFGAFPRIACECRRAQASRCFLCLRPGRALVCQKMSGEMDLSPWGGWAFSGGKSSIPPPPAGNLI